MIIYFTGIDGSGKSSIINELSKTELIKSNNYQIIFARYSPKIVRVFTRLLMKKIVKITDNHSKLTANDYSVWGNFKKKLTRSKTLNYILYFIQTIDYLLQIKSILRAIKKKPKEKIILDRFVIDFIVDQSVNYGDVSNNILTKYLLKQLKYFDYVFYLTVPNEIAIIRKNDIPSIQYLIDRRKYYNSYIKLIPNVFIVETSGKLETSLQLIMKELNSYQ